MRKGEITSVYCSNGIKEALQPQNVCFLSQVESLKERLEHTQQELAKSHDSNRDLKTKLQTVVREKDPGQVSTNFHFGVFFVVSFQTYECASGEMVKVVVL